MPSPNLKIDRTDKNASAAEKVEKQDETDGISHTIREQHAPRIKDDGTWWSVHLAAVEGEERVTTCCPTHAHVTAGRWHV